MDIILTEQVCYSREIDVVDAKGKKGKGHAVPEVAQKGRKITINDKTAEAWIAAGIAIAAKDKDKAGG